jgi:hypothetical protein
MPHAQRVIAIRCEPRIERTSTGQVATFGSASIIEACRSEKTGRWSEPVRLVFDDPKALWEEITGYTRVHGRTWLVGHTMGNELRIAQAFRWMPVLQWTFNPDPIVSDTTLSIGWHNGKRSLLAVDLFSYLPHSLEVLRARSLAFGECEAIFTAFMDLVSLQHDHDLGNFSRTGASNASNHWRHRHMTSKVSIHDDTAALEAEREASLLDEQRPGESAPTATLMSGICPLLILVLVLTLHCRCGWSATCQPRIGRQLDTQVSDSSTLSWIVRCPSCCHA